jgi:hypothetical protein
MLCAFLNIRSEEARRQSPAEARSGRRSFSSNFETRNAQEGDGQPCRLARSNPSSGRNCPDVGETVNLDFVHKYGRQVATGWWSCPLPGTKQLSSCEWISGALVAELR